MAQPPRLEHLEQTAQFDHDGKNFLLIVRKASRRAVGKKWSEVVCCKPANCSADVCNAAACQSFMSRNARRIRDQNQESQGVVQRVYEHRKC